MINNRVGLWGMLTVAMSLTAGCAAARSEPPAPLQGIVEHDRTVLAFELGGRVRSITPERGAAVVAGTELATLDDGLERPVLDARRAELAYAEAQLALLEAGPRREELRATRAQLDAVTRQHEVLSRTLDRQLALLQTGAVAPSVRDPLDGQLAALDGQGRALREQLSGLRRGARAEELEAAAARRDAAAAALALAEARLARTVLRAPTSGVVTDRHVEVGEVVAPGTPALTVADLDHPYVDVYVPEASLAEVTVGRPAEVRIDAAAELLVGRVEYVGDRTEFTPRYLFSESERPNLVVRARVRVDDPRHALRAGVPAFVRLGAGR